MSAVQETTKSPKATKVVKKVAPKKAASSHPTFSEMIKAGIKQLNERSGSSRIALLKFITSTYKLDEKQANVHLKMALKRGVKDGALKQVKGVGSNGSFKLADAAKKAPVKKVTEGKPVVKKTVTKKTVTKKAAPAASDKPKKNVKKVVKPKIPKPVADKPVEQAKPVETKAALKSVKQKVEKKVTKKSTPVKTDVKKTTKAASRQKTRKN